MRTRARGCWWSGDHFSRIEVGDTIANSITRVAKDSMVLIWEERTSSDLH